jgi:2,4-diaminopentanoate dehydrogenase
VSKRVVVWGTGFVGRMVVREIVRHREFELVGVGVHDPEKVGRDAGELCGTSAIGVKATSEIDELVSLAPDAVAHYGPTAAHADENIRVVGAFLSAGIDVVSTAMTPWIWPTAANVPGSWVEPIERACEAGGASCFTTGIDPGFANDLLPMTLMGLCSEVRSVKAREMLDYTNYEGDYETEMGIGSPPEKRCLLEVPEILALSWGATIPMIAHAVGTTIDEVTTTWEKWVTDSPIETAKGAVAAGTVAAVRFTINGLVRGEPRISLEHVNRVGRRSAPDWPRGSQDDVYQVLIDGTPSITQETAFRFTDGSGRDAAAAGCLATGFRALNAIPAVNDLPPGWVTALDLPLIAGRGTIG